MKAKLHVLFDLDGTLLDTEGLYTQAAAAVCCRFGKTFSLELKRRIMGSAAPWAAATIVSELALPLSSEGYLAAQEEALIELMPQLATMDGAEELLLGLEYHGVPWAIATSGTRAITERKLSIQPFLRAARQIVCGDDPELRHGKPAPDIYLLAQARLGAAHEHCVVVEDSLNGVRAGVAAAMRTIALVDPRWGFSLAEFGDADDLVSSLREILPLLGLTPSLQR